jgi:S-(hydroxymethyl)glutathione dehydrogenase/alcohol dehydrogenase
LSRPAAVRDEARAPGNAYAGSVRAAVLRAAGEPLVVEDIRVDPPRAGEVEVRVLAAGVCHSDLHRARGNWGEIPPTVLGHEAAGVVEAVGEGVTSVVPGDRVVLSWHYPCLRCPQCLGGRQWLCSGSRAPEHLQMDGSTRLHRRDGSGVLAYLCVGAFGERTVVPAQAAIPVDDAVPPEVSCLVGCCVSTGVGAVLNTASVPAGATVAVIGLGGVGLSVVMGARLAEAAAIVAVDKAEEKLELARELGATDAIVAKDPKTTRRAIRSATDGGADFAFEAIGLTSTMEVAFASLARGGAAVLVGLTPFGTRVSFDSFQFVDRGHRILGSVYGSTTPARDFARLVELHRAGRLPIHRLIEAHIALEEVNGALAALERGQGRRRVIVY